MSFCFLSTETCLARDMDVQICLQGLIFNSSVPSGTEEVELLDHKKTHSSVSFLASLSQSLIFRALSG